MQNGNTSLTSELDINDNSFYFRGIGGGGLHFSKKYQANHQNYLFKIITPCILGSRHLFKLIKNVSIIKLFENTCFFENNKSNIKHFFTVKPITHYLQLHKIL